MLQINWHFFKKNLILQKMKQLVQLLFLHYQPQKRTSKLDIILFLRQFATLLSAGITLTQSCDILEKSQTKQGLRLIIYAIKRELLSGKMLHASFLMHQKYFDAFTCQLIRVGEHIGKLEMILTMIADHHEKQFQFQQRIQQALFYPGLIAFSALSMTFSMFIFVIPKFSELFQASSHSLPLLTLWIFFLANQLRNFLWLIIFLFLICAFALLHDRIRHHVFRFLSHVIVRLPFLKSLLHQLLLVKFARQLALMLHAGMSIMAALELITTLTTQTMFVTSVQYLQKQLASGVPLHHAMEKTNFFPVFMLQMIKVGEESGQLDAMLIKTADFIERDVDQVVKHFNQLLEPLIMLLLGVLIGALVIGMYLPIFKLGSTI